MHNIIESPVVVCRPALRKDTQEVLELSSHIWEGGDYLPKVWEEWLNDPDGMLGVAEVNGRVAGTFKLTKFAEDDWYLEGLRVHPDFQDRGIATHIHDYVVELWRQTGKGILRLTTGSNNVKVHRMCERSGFKRIAEFIPYRGSVLMDGTGNFTPLSAEEAPRALEIVNSNPVHRLSSSLINLGWVFAKPQIKHILEVIQYKHAWWWKDGSGFLSIWEDDESEVPEPGVELLACQRGDLCEMLVDYRRLMGAIGYKSAGWVAPNRPEVIACLDKADFARSWDISLYIFELRS